MPQGLILPQVDPTTIALPSSGSVALVVNLLGQLTVVKPDGSVNPISPINQTTAPQVVNSAAAGNSNVGPGNGDLTVFVNVSGLATVRTISLLNVGLGALQAGFEIEVVFLFPGPLISGVTLQVFDGNTAGTLLFNFVTDGVQASAIGRFVWNGTNWLVKETKVPAIT